MTFNGQSATVTNWTSNSITAIVPTGATTGPVVVTVGGVQINAVGFTVLLPVISSLSTSSGDPGTQVVISGTNFDNAQGSGGVTFAGVAAPIVNWNAGSITAEGPVGAVDSRFVAADGNACTLAAVSRRQS